MDGPRRLRVFDFVTAGGDHIGLSVSGHELDLTDPGLFRVIRYEAGRPVCVAAYDRQLVAAVIATNDENPEPAGDAGE